MSRPDPEPNDRDFNHWVRLRNKLLLFILVMDRYDTDLWIFLKQNDEKSLGLSDRLKMAQKFWEKFKEIQLKVLSHRDLKPSNVLINLTPDGKWTGQMEITDFGIASRKANKGKKAGTSGWTEGYSLTSGDNSDGFATRLLIFMLSLIHI